MPSIEIINDKGEVADLEVPEGVSLGRAILEAASGGWRPAKPLSAFEQMAQDPRTDPQTAVSTLATGGARRLSDITEQKAPALFPLARAAEAVTGFLTPRTGGEVAAQVGLGQASRVPSLLGRLGTGAVVGGATRGLEEGPEAIPGGAAAGAGVAQLGSVFDRVVNTLGGAALSKRIRRYENPEELIGVIQRETGLPVPRVPGQRPADALKSAVEKADLAAQASTRLNSQRESLVAMADAITQGGVTVNSPAIAQYLSILGVKKPPATFSLKDAIHWYEQMWSEAFSPEAIARATRAGRTVRSLRGDALNEIKGSLPDAHLRTFWDETAEEFAVTMALHRTWKAILEKEGGSAVFLRRGGIELGPVQREFDTQAAEGGLHITKERFRAVQARLRRQEPAPAADISRTDDPGQSLLTRLGFRPGQPPFVAASPPGGSLFPQFVGRPPVIPPGSAAATLVEPTERQFRRGIIPRGPLP